MDLPGRQRVAAIETAAWSYPTVWIVGLALSLATLAACPTTRPERPTAARQVADVVAGLAVPPNEGAAQDLAWLAERGEPNRGAAAVARLEYLLALFDDARFAKSTGSRTVLLSALDLPLAAATGTGATEAVLAALADSAQHALVAARKADASTQQRAAQLHTLIEFDRNRPTKREDVIGWFGPLKALAAEPGTIGAAARLRRFGVCSEALAAATRGSDQTRLQHAAFCLYANHAADPAPFFESDASRRPPPPRWRDLATDATAQLKGDVPNPPRWFQAAIDGATESLEELIATHLDDLPTLVLERGVDVPAVSAIGVPPFDHTPLVLLGADHQSNSAAIAAMANPLVGDGRGIIAIAAPRHLDSGRLLHAAQAAANVTAASLELIVDIARPVRRDEGSYWALHAAGDEVRTAGALRLSLVKLWKSDESLRSRDWDPDRATLGLHLLVEPRRWVLVGTDGVIASIGLPGAEGDNDPNYADATLALRAAARDVLAAYRRERGVVVRPGDATTVDNLVAAIAAVRTDAVGTPLFDLVALGSRPFAARGNTLAARIGRRLRASATSESLSASAQLAVLECYRNALDEKPALATTLRFDRGTDDTWRRTRGDRDKALSACIGLELNEAFRLADTVRVEIRLELAAAR